MDISQHDVNVLVYRYLRQSGFTSTADLFGRESRIDVTPNRSEFTNAQLNLVSIVRNGLREYKGGSYGGDALGEASLSLRSSNNRMQDISDSASGAGRPELAPGEQHNRQSQRAQAQPTKSDNERAIPSTSMGPPRPGSTEESDGCETTTSARVLESTRIKAISDLSNHRVEQVTRVGKRHALIVLGKTDDPNESLAVRIRHGSSGYSEWMNELQAYLLPNFQHNNVLAYLGADKKFKGLGETSNPSDEDQTGILGDIELTNLSDTKENLTENASRTQTKSRRMRIEYWLVNKFSNSMTLRDYLKSNKLTWDQMIHIAKGIANGLHFLHENTEYQQFDSRRAIDGFLRSTNGALKKVSFKEQNEIIKMEPHLSLTIIHRNISTENIVLNLNDLNPCIWNFGSSYIQYPFQPTNHLQLVEGETKQAQLTSPYSSPEILQEKGHMTLAAMKSIDMYACGMLFWELISRCILPPLPQANALEMQDRNCPDDYYEPFGSEFIGLKPTPAMLEYVVCKLRARPKIKVGWLAGKMSNRFVQTFQDLWDHDFEARLHTSTVIDRLNKLTPCEVDRRCKSPYQLGKIFDVNTMWPPVFKGAVTLSCPRKCEPNIQLEDVT